MHDPRATRAAANNADLCAALFTAHGVGYARSDEVLVADDSPPPFFPDLVTLAPDAIATVKACFSDVSERVGGRGALKDSFAVVDPAPLGLRILFEAEWIWHAAQVAAWPTGWTHITSPRMLAKWEAAWGKTPDKQFPDSLLHHSALSFLAHQQEGKITAGCLINRSADCAGISNVFGTYRWPDLRQAAHSAAPDLPLTGYEHGLPLAKARTAGFTCVGALRVLVPN